MKGNMYEGTSAKPIAHCRIISQFRPHFKKIRYNFTDFALRIGGYFIFEFFHSSRKFETIFAESHDSFA